MMNARYYGLVRKTADRDADRVTGELAEPGNERDHERRDARREEERSRYAPASIVYNVADHRGNAKEYD
jgi:hypothetical protein